MPPLSDWCFPQRLGVVDEAGELSGARIAADTGSLLELLQGLGMRPAIARTATEAFRSAAQELTHSEPGARVARYEDLRRRTSSWITTAIEFGTWGHDADTSRYYETLFDQRSDPGPGDGIGLDALERELGLESKPSLQQALRTRWLTRTSEVASARLGELGPGERADRTQTATTLVNRALVAPGGVMGMPGRSLVPIVAMLLPGAASSSGDLTTARTTLDRAVAALDLRPSGLAGGSASSGSATPPEIHEMVPLGAGVPASTVPPPVTDEVEHFGPPLDPGAEPHFLERSHPLVNIRPLSDALVASMRDGLLEAMRTNPHPAGHVGLEAFGTRLHAILDSRLLSTAGEELRSEAGFEIPLTRVPGAGPALALRLRASDPAAVEENDAAGRLSGQAVQLQRWAFSSPEKLSSASSSDLRTGGLATSGHWDLDRYGIGRISLNGLVRVVVNQLSRIVTAGSGVSAYTILRSREPSYVFDYTMNWEFRLLETGSDHTWTRLPLREGVRGERLRVWFPRSQSTVARGEAALAPTRPDPAVRGILEHAPVVGVEDVPSAHRLVEDVLAAFPVLADLHPDSLADLKDFLSADDVKANFPHLAFGDGMPTTDLRSSTGSALGFLHFSTPLEENLQPAGPNLENGVVETYLVSVSRAQLSVTVSNAVSFALSLVLGLRNGLSPVADVRASAGASVAYRSEHTLISGGSTKLVRSLRAAGPTQRSAGTFRLQAELVRPAGAPLLPVATSRLPNASYPVNLQIPSNDALVNTAETPARHLPPELLHLRVLGLSTTTTRVTGVDGLARELETLLREQGYLPVPQEPGTHVANALEMLADNPLTRLAVHQETLDRARLANVREMNRLRGRAGLRASVDNAIAGGALFTFEKPTRSGVERISATLHTSRSYQPGGDEAGVTQGLRLPGVQTLNFVASSTPGEWQSSVTPAAATVEANVSGQSGGHLTPGANPHYTDGAVVGGGVGGSSATSYLSGSSVGTGHEYYLLSPTSQGTTQFDVPVTHTLTVTGSFGPQRDLGPAPGRMTLAVPDFRLLTQASTEPRPARPATRTVTPEDRVRLTGEGQILLPETALIEWIEGSGALQNLVRENFGTLRPPDAAVPAQVLPGAAEAVPAGDVVPAGPGAAVVRVPRTALGVIGGWFRAAWEVLAAGPATIARAIVGENLTGPRRTPTAFCTALCRPSTCTPTPCASCATPTSSRGWRPRHLGRPGRRPRGQGLPDGSEGPAAHTHDGRGALVAVHHRSQRGRQHVEFPPGIPPGAGAGAGRVRPRRPAGARVGLDPRGADRGQHQRDAGDGGGLDQDAPVQRHGGVRGVDPPGHPAVRHQPGGPGRRAPGRAGGQSAERGPVPSHRQRSAQPSTAGEPGRRPGRDPHGDPDPARRRPPAATALPPEPRAARVRHRDRGDPGPGARRAPERDRRRPGEAGPGHRDPGDERVHARPAGPGQREQQLARAAHPDESRPPGPRSVQGRPPVLGLAPDRQHQAAPARRPGGAGGGPGPPRRHRRRGQRHLPHQRAGHGPARADAGTDPDHRHQFPHQPGGPAARRERPGGRADAHADLGLPQQRGHLGHVHP